MDTTPRSTPAAPTPGPATRTLSTRLPAVPGRYTSSVYPGTDPDPPVRQGPVPSSWYS